MRTLESWFAVEEEEFIAEITRTVDRDLPPKIQCLIASTPNDYLTEGRFFVPSDVILDTDKIKRTIKRRYCPYVLLPAIRDILHPSLPNSGEGYDRLRGGRGRVPRVVGSGRVAWFVWLGVWYAWVENVADRG